MRHKVAALVLASASLAAAVSFGVLPTAHAALADKRCFDEAATVVGTSGNDVISVSASEPGATITVNGKTRFAPVGPIVIVSGDGHDKISFGSDGGGGVLVCSGSGDDVLNVTMTDGVSTGGGKDRVNIYLQCSATPIIYGAETVDITGFDSVEEGPCN